MAIFIYEFRVRNLMYFVSMLKWSTAVLVCVATTLPFGIQHQSKTAYAQSELQVLNPCETIEPSSPEILVSEIETATQRVLVGLDHPTRCRSSQVLTSVMKRPNNQNPDGGNGCETKAPGSALFPNYSQTPSNPSNSWFFSSFKSCQGLSSQIIRTCPSAKSLRQKNLILQGNWSELVTRGCTWSPDGRLIFENVGPIWSQSGSKLTQRAQHVQYRGSRKLVTSSKVASLSGMNFGFPKNGCLTTLTTSTCVRDGNPLKLTPTQLLIIERANSRLGLLYGSSTGGLTGLRRDVQFGGKTVSFDCSSFAQEVLGRTEKSSKAGWNSSTYFDNGIKPILGRPTSFEAMNSALPVGSVIAKKGHVQVVVGFLQVSNQSFEILVAEAPNFISGVVRINGWSLNNLKKEIDKNNYRIYFPEFN